jgi:hypothetical protein
MKLRWLVRKPYIQNKLIFNEKNKVLQMLVLMNCPERGHGEYWVDVPVVEEYEQCTQI